MFFSVSKTTNNVTIHKQTSFWSNNILERDHIEKWVLENPQILCEELLIISSEYDRFDKTNERLDVLALDKQGNLVVVELKRDDSGKSVELQAIKYAAYCSTLTLEDIINMRKEYLDKSFNDAKLYEEIEESIFEFIEYKELTELNDRPRVILVSREFRPEVTATVLWLRKFNIDISCVKFTVYEMNEDNIGISSERLIPLPEAEDFIIRTERKEARELEKSKVDSTRFNFLRGISDALIESSILTNDERLTVNKRGQYLQVKTPTKAVHFEFCFREKRKIEIGLHFERTNNNENSCEIERLQDIQTDLENTLNHQVTFQKNWNGLKMWSRVYTYIDVDMTNNNMVVEIIDLFSKFYKILLPDIQKFY